MCLCTFLLEDVRTGIFQDTSLQLHASKRHAHGVPQHVFKLVRSHCGLVLLQKHGPMWTAAETVHDIQLQAEAFDYIHQAKDNPPPGNKTVDFKWEARLKVWQCLGCDRLVLQGHLSTADHTALVLNSIHKDWHAAWTSESGGSQYECTGKTATALGPPFDCHQ
jgi:hypothetical protein